MNHTKKQLGRPHQRVPARDGCGIEKLRRQLEDLEPYCGSEALNVRRPGWLPAADGLLGHRDRPDTTGVSPSTLYAENKAGRLPFKTIGSRNALIRVVDVDKWMEGRSDGR